MSDLLGLGAAGVRAYQTALDIIGENISNANVAGYARRQAVVTENPSAGTGYPLVRDVKAGSGVNVSGVLRAYNSFLTNDARTAAGDYARAAARQGWLDQIQSYLNNDSQGLRSEEHTSELQSLMRTSYAVFCLKKKKTKKDTPSIRSHDAD